MNFNDLANNEDNIFDIKEFIDNLRLLILLMRTKYILTTNQLKLSIFLIK